MKLTACFDESGTHAGSGVAAMAGFVGDKRQWAKFEKRTAKLFTRFRVDQFHAIDVRRSDKDFAGWSIDRKIEFLDEFQHIINETLLGGVAAFITDTDYDYYADLYWPRGTRRDTKYGLLFRACLAQVIDSAIDLSLSREPELRVVVEDGHRNAPDVQRIYETVQKRIGPHRGLAGLQFRTKDSLPLAAADMFAYTAWGNEVGQKPIGIPRKPTRSDDSYRSNCFKVVLNRDSLDSLHEQAIALLHRDAQARTLPQ